MAAGPALDLQLAQALHRDSGEAVIFRQVGTGGREPQVGYLASDMGLVASEHPEMMHGGCVSVHSFDPRAFFPRYGHANKNGVVRRASRRKAADVSRLNAVFLDLDVAGHPQSSGMSALDADALLLRACAAAGLPQPSAVSYTGGGLHAYWFLGTEEGGLPATSENVARLRRIQEALASVLPKDLSVDRQVIGNVAQVGRIPGTVHPKYGVAVRGRVARTEAWQLANDFEAPLELPQWDPPRERSRTFVSAGSRSGERSPPSDSPRVAAGRKGYIERWRGLLEEVQRVIDFRGGIRRGGRHDFLLAVACILGRLGYHGEALVEELLLVDAQCQPPLARQGKGREWMSYAAKFGNKAAPITHGKLATWCGVTLDEVGAIGLRRLRPDFVSGYETRGGRSRRKRKGRPLTERRRLAVAQLWDGEMSLEQVRRLLPPALIPSSRSTIHSDLVALGLVD